MKKSGWAEGERDSHGATTGLSDNPTCDTETGLCLHWCLSWGECLGTVDLHINQPLDVGCSQRRCGACVRQLSYIERSYRRGTRLRGQQTAEGMPRSSSWVVSWRLTTSVAHLLHSLTVLALSINLSCKQLPQDLVAFPSQETERRGGLVGWAIALTLGSNNIITVLSSLTPPSSALLTCSCLLGRSVWLPGGTSPCQPAFLRTWPLYSFHHHK